ncbi:MAG: prohibitin family protein [Bacteroidetes bacterium]|nr:prohibitin family protein [Bacteroidota bacterium]
MRKLVLPLLAFMIIATACTVVRQGEVGVKRRAGRIVKVYKEPGMRLINPFLTRVFKVPTRSVNTEVTLWLPSKEGLNITCTLSILYHVQADSAKSIIQSIGKQYEEIVILPILRSAASDVSARFYAKDMHTAERAQIEKEIKTQMSRLLNDRGFIVEAVLLKTVRLPDKLYEAIEAKLQAEQDAQRMEFVLQKEQQEAERLRIQAEGQSKANSILQQSLTKEILQYKSLEAFERLANSINTKVIFSNGQLPFFLQQEAVTPNAPAGQEKGKPE